MKLAIHPRLRFQSTDWTDATTLCDRQKEDEDETRQTAQEVRSTDGRDGGVTSPTVAAVVSSPPPPPPPTDGAAIFCRQEVNVQNSGEAKRETASFALRPTDWTFFRVEIARRRRIQILPRSESEKRRKREIVPLKRLCDHAESPSPLLGRVAGKESHS